MKAGDVEKSGEKSEGNGILAFALVHELINCLSEKVREINIYAPDGRVAK
jgi:hypothetical protein